MGWQQESEQKRNLERRRAVARQWPWSGPYGLEQTDQSVFLQMFGQLGGIMSLILGGFIGLFAHASRGLLFFMAAAVPSAGCLLASALLRNRARRRRQAAAGQAVQSIGTLPLAIAMGFWREIEAIDRAESAADRIAAGNGTGQPGGKRKAAAGHAREDVDFDTAIAAFEREQAARAAGKAAGGDAVAARAVRIMDGSEPAARTLH